MKRSLLNKLFIALVLLTATACKSRKIAQQTAAANTPAAAEKSDFSKSDIIRKVRAAMPNFNTLSIKAKADLSINNNSNDVNMNIRIKKDQVIWVSVTVSVLEVARALITPDSIKIMNRVQNEYTAKPFSYIHQFANKAVDFRTVQALITGSAVPGAISENATVNLSEGRTSISGSTAGLLYSMIFNAANNLIQSNLADNSAGQKLSVDYADILSIAGQQIPHSVHINSNAGNRSVSIKFKYNNVTLNESLDFPFSVPKRFSVKN